MSEHKLTVATALYGGSIVGLTKLGVINGVLGFIAVLPAAIIGTFKLIKMARDPKKTWRNLWYDDKDR